MRGSRTPSLGSGSNPASSSSPSWQKADKSALAAKVSRVQFDATTEQLNHMMQELVAKMSGQEQDWQKMLDRLLMEMDSKAGGAGQWEGDPEPHLMPSAHLAHTPAPCHRCVAGPPGAGSTEAAAGGPLEIPATAAQGAFPALPGGRCSRHAEVGAGCGTLKKACTTCVPPRRGLGKVHGSLGCAV